MASTTYKWPAMTFIAYFFILKWRLLSVSIQDARWPKKTNVSPIFKNPQFSVFAKPLKNIWRFSKYSMREREWNARWKGDYHPWRLLCYSGKETNYKLSSPAFCHHHFFLSIGLELIQLSHQPEWKQQFNSNPERLITSSSLAAKREELANWASFSQGA